MKTKFFLVTALSTFIFSLPSCKKQDTATPTAQTSATTAPSLVVSKDYLTMSGTYNESSFPSSKGNVAEKPSITGIVGNSVVITGGSNPISISYTDSQNDISEIIVGIKGKAGYYTIPKNTFRSALDSILDLDVVFTQNIDGEFVLIITLKDLGGNIGEPIELPIIVHKVGTGDLQVSLSWNELDDIDLHLIQPNGSEIYYVDPEGDDSLNYLTGGFLDLDSNPGCEIDSINNENITYGLNSHIINGKYIVKVDYYSDCTFDSVPVKYTVTARYKGKLLTPTSGSNPYYGTFLPQTDDEGASGSGVEAMQFVINDSRLAGNRMPFRVAEINYHLPIKNKKN